MMFWYGPHGPAGAWSIVMSVVMLASWGGIAALVVYAVRSGTGRGRATERADPQRILAERLARGEIDAQEYRARLEVLNSTS